jgi:hypothetical protein
MRNAEPAKYCAVALTTAAIALGPASSQGISSLPNAPVGPTSYDDCSRFSAQWAELKASVIQRHQACLNSASCKHRGSRPTEKAHGVCSCPNCEELHREMNLLSSGDLSRYGESQVRRCRDEVAKLQQLQSSYDEIGRGVSAAMQPNVKPDGRDSEFKVLRAGWRDAIRAGTKQLDQSIQEAPAYLSGKNLKRFVADVEDTKTLFRGLDKALTYSKYATYVGQAVNSDSTFERNEAIGGAAYEFASDIAKHGLKAVIPRLFGPKTAAVLLGPAAWTMGIALDVATPEHISPDPIYVIRDKSGRFTLADKQRALEQMWKQQERHGRAYSEGHVRVLMDLTQTVYETSSSNSMGR